MFMILIKSPKIAMVCVLVCLLKVVVHLIYNLRIVGEKLFRPHSSCMVYGGDAHTCLCEESGNFALKNFYDHYDQTSR